MDVLAPVGGREDYFVSGASASARGGLDGEGNGNGNGMRKEKGVWCHLVEVRVLENHQNGKDTHVRGIQIFSLADETGVRRGIGAGGTGMESEDVSMDEDSDGDVVKREEGANGRGRGMSLFNRQGWGRLDEPDWMRDPVIR